MDNIIILCTTNSQLSAETIANALVEAKCAACVNIIPKIVSVYRWEDKIEKDEEYLMLIKTRKELFESVRDRIIRLHPYDVPEIVSLDITDGSKSYLEWIKNSTSL